MCGIGGYVGDFEPGLASAMSHALAHRGPDDAGRWSSAAGTTTLIHRRLSIIDLSPLGHQPMSDESASVTLVFNGEIYNYRELRRELKSAGHRFRGNSDTEVLLRGYLQHGPDVLRRLNGIFAVAIHDGRTDTLLLARDPLGVKPLYVARCPRGFLFASELKAILAERTVSRELDSAALMRYLVFQWCPGEGTPLAAVRKLTPGTALTVRNGTIDRTWQYYRLEMREPDGERSAESLAAELEGTLRRAVHRQMVADVPVGAFLSGGLDSSAVVAFARELAGPAGLDCFTIAPSGPGFRAEGVAEDLPYAQRVARHLGVRLHAIDVDATVISRLPETIYHLDEPLADPAAINVLLIAQLARQHGIKVLLSGAGGDDLLSGYRRHLALASERFWAWLPLWVRSAAAGMLRALPQRRPAMRRLVKAMRHAGESGDARLFSYFYWYDPAALPGLFSGDIGSLVGGLTAPFSEALAGFGSELHGLNRMLYLEQRFFLIDHNLNYTDKLSMARGVETRVPFLDLEFVAFANSLPASLKQVGAEGKWLFKRAMERHLPREVIYRTKTGFGAPLRYWLRNDLRELVAECLSEHALQARGIFDARVVHQLIERDRRGRIDAGYTIFALLCCELWCRTFLDQTVPHPVS